MERSHMVEEGGDLHKCPTGGRYLERKGKSVESNGMTAVSAAEKCKERHQTA